MDNDSTRLSGLQREFEAGRIDANTYIAAGGDPDVVQAVHAARAATPEPLGTRILRAVVALAAGLLILACIGRLIGQAGSPVLALLLGVAGLVLIMLARKI